MRCLPIALAYTDKKQMEEITYLHSKMTHYDDQAADACVIYNRIALRVLNGEELQASIEKEITNTIYEPILKSAPDCSPDGYVVHTMNWVIHWLLRYETFEEIVIEAANMGGDSDTVAAIAGGLKGIEVGYSHLPTSFTKKILCADLLKDISDKLTKIRTFEEGL
ncbi:ADP-ribosylglycohydrolase family protein [Parageobacillus thermoglucosidasius]|uniref:ADP-ribosylglycohydrolase family protein n=1 Tax=Parageobacillus thermoglucosidasius TaxID=1426 RepID=UPI0027416AA5|nr:ADP-ribosylglycohydrolase family protein [Parageobacillus thermoglucosidasius]